MRTWLLNNADSPKGQPVAQVKLCTAFEVMLNSPRIAELIKTGNITKMNEIMEKSPSSGMQTFDTALYKLYLSGKISRKEALKFTNSENNLRLKSDLMEKTLLMQLR